MHAHLYISRTLFIQNEFQAAKNASAEAKSEAQKRQEMLENSLQALGLLGCKQNKENDNEFQYERERGSINAPTPRVLGVEEMNQPLGAKASQIELTVGITSSCGM